MTDEPEPERVEGAKPSVGVAAERIEQAKLGEALEPGGREPCKLIEDPLARRLVDERRLLPDQALGIGIETEAELVLEPNGA